MCLCTIGSGFIKKNQIDLLATEIATCLRRTATWSCQSPHTTHSYRYIHSHAKRTKWINHIELEREHGVGFIRFINSLSLLKWKIYDNAHLCVANRWKHLAVSMPEHSNSRSTMAFAFIFLLNLFFNWHIKSNLYGADYRIWILN